ncbi:hypothetical protein MT418_005227 [Batrachochytrium dendrobatidis]
MVKRNRLHAAKPLAATFSNSVSDIPPNTTQLDTESLVSKHHSPSSPSRLGISANQVSGKEFVVSPVVKATSKSTTARGNHLYESTSNVHACPDESIQPDNDSIEKENEFNNDKRKRVPPREFWKVRDIDDQLDDDDQQNESDVSAGIPHSHSPTHSNVVYKSNLKKSSKVVSKDTDSNQAMNDTTSLTKVRAHTVENHPHLDHRDVYSNDELLEAKVRRKRHNKRVKHVQDPSEKSVLLPANETLLDSSIVSETKRKAESKPAAMGKMVTQPHAGQSALKGSNLSSAEYAEKDACQNSSAISESNGLKTSQDSVSALDIHDVHQPSSQSNAPCTSDSQEHCSHCKDTKTTSTHVSTRSDHPELLKIKKELQILKKQYDELFLVGIVEAKKTFDSFQTASNVRLQACNELTEHLTSENKRLLERVETLSKENIKLKKPASKTTLDTLSGLQDQSHATKQTIETGIFERFVKEWKFKPDSTESKESCNTVDALARPVQGSVEPSAAEATRPKPTDEYLEKLATFEKMSMIYKAFTGIHILGVERVVRSVDDDSGCSRDLSFNEFRCQQNGPRHAMEFSFYAPCNKDVAICMFNPTKVTMLNGGIPNLPMFLQEEIEFTIDMAQRFFSRIAAYLHDTDSDDTTLKEIVE